MIIKNNIFAIINLEEIMAYSYKGAITFGLVYIPIVLTASIKNNDIGFNLIDKKTMSRVKYKKTCVDCKK